MSKNFEILKSVCIDSTPLDTTHKTRGIGRYVKNLLKHIHIISEQIRPQQLRVSTSFFKPRSTSFITYIKRPKWPEFRLHWMFNQLFLSKTISSMGVKIFHSTDPYGIPISNNFTTVATAYDLIPWIFKDDYIKHATIDQRLAYKAILNNYKKVNHLISISESTKKDFINFLNISPNKISVIPLGVDLNLETQGSIVSEKWPDNYFLYVGGSDHRKNLKFLMLCYSKVHQFIKEKLVLAGKFNAPELDMLQKLSKEFSISHKVVFTGYVSDNQLVSLYKNATAFVFPTKYEGFGLPVLEAMTYECPVLTSNISSLPEIVGDAGILIEPENVELFSQWLIKLSQNSAIRTTLKKHGLQQAQQFSWNRCATETLNLYMNLLE